MSRIMRTAAMSLLLAISATGCLSVGVYTRQVPPAESYHFWAHGFLWGLVGSDMNADSVCSGRPLARVDTYMSLGNMVATYLTGGIYAPMSVEITCGKAVESTPPQGGL